MDLYPWIVFVHAAALLIWFFTHGAAVGVAFALKGETDPSRVRALHDMSKRSVGAPTTVIFVVGLVAGIVAAFAGGHWGQLWIWISLVTLVVIAGLMTPLGSMKLRRIGAAAGIPAKDGTVTEDIDEMRRLIDAWNPVPLAAIGFGGFLLILWLMLAKPF
jgi:hypothetical protein